MRGQVVALSASDGVMRITPADAGTSGATGSMD